MFSRLRMLWVRVRDSLWFIPTVLTLLAAALAIWLVQLEQAMDTTKFQENWLIAVSLDGAREILSTIAGSIITVTGVVFSVTIVALQLSSSQFTPRVLRNFMADQSNQMVLGVFIATFTYTLLVLRVVRSTGENEEFVPQIAVSVAILFSLVSIGFLIHFIHHAARSIQAAVVLVKVTTSALEHVKRLFPEEIGKPEGTLPEEEHLPSNAARIVTVEKEGYLEAVDDSSLFRLGEEQHLLIRMLRPVGAFMIQGEPLAEVWANEPLGDETQKQIRDAFVIGEQRTPEQDLEFFLLELSDMAVKALSPSINDPTTAKHCIDRLTQILRAVGSRRPPAPLRTKEGKVHFIAQTNSFETSVELAFGDILRHGRDNDSIVKKLLGAIDLLESLLPTERHEALQNFRAKAKVWSKSETG
ncbi:DUF2254 domain-containing protein [Nitrosomonas sp. ANs5]|uniref:DUF2254 domain-containing protein n=1 Tax=Nitrosomonas sp. ANs5 TaxID=3423941 RepID=UPI003D32DBBE